jgi:D-alanyl-D-alanine carboxypeptidase
VAGARARGLTAIDGLEVLDHQVRHQYERMAEVDEMLDSPREFAAATASSSCARLMGMAN